MSIFVDCFFDGRVVSIEKYDNESSVSFSRRCSFILFFASDPDNYDSAVKHSNYHASMIQYGTIYDKAIDDEVSRLRNIMLKRQKK